MDLLDAVKCGVCFDLYTDPRILPCGHTYCHPCLQRTLHTIEEKAGKFYRCPECRGETEETKNGLPRNYAVLSMVDKIKSSPGSGGFGKCDGCQKTALLGELFRCSTCTENSASAEDEETRVCCMCIVASHAGHEYQKLDVASRKEYDEARDKIDSHRMASEAKMTMIINTFEKLKKTVAERTASLTRLKDDVNDSNALTKAQLGDMVQQAEHMMDEANIAEMLEAFDEFSGKLSNCPPPVPPMSDSIREWALRIRSEYSSS